MKYDPAELINACASQLGWVRSLRRHLGDSVETRSHPNPQIYVARRPGLDGTDVFLVAILKASPDDPDASKCPFGWVKRWSSSFCIDDSEIMDLGAAKLVQVVKDRFDQTIRDIEAIQLVGSGI